MNVYLGKFIVLVGACVFLVSCAQVGPPLPPSLELPKPPSDLHVIRKGNQVTLTWSQPTLTTHRQSIRYLGPTRVCRSFASEISECGSPIASVPPLPLLAAKSRQNPGPQARPHADQLYSDTVPISAIAQSPTAEITYAVEVLNRDGRSAGLSNRVSVPAVPTLPPPPDLQAELTMDGVVLNWTSQGESEAQPGIQHRYRIYRRDEGTGKDAIAGETPVGEAGNEHFLDTSLEWEHTYQYRAVAVTIEERAGGDIQVEGDDSPTVRVVAHYVFPPAVP